MKSVKDLFNYVVYISGISGAIVLVKSTTVISLDIQFEFNL